MSFLNDFQIQSKREDARGRCLHFANEHRCNNIIAAHSIQKGGQLNLIAEGGHVYKLSVDTIQSQTVIHAKKIGVKKVSTFNGFCKHHDNQLFKVIDEIPIKPSNHQIGLYAYRSLCREYFVKENAVNVLLAVDGHQTLDAKRKAFVASSLEGQALGFERLKIHKSYYDTALRSESYDEFEYVCFSSNSKCALQLSGLLNPDFDFTGRHLQDIGNRSSPLDLITFFTAPTIDGWAFCFAWHASSSKTCLLFMQSLIDYVDNKGNLSDALFRLAISSENHAIRISWWDQLSNQAKNSIFDRLLFMLTPGIPVPQNYLSEGCEGIATWDFENVSTTLGTD
jgi:hypothetical protein